MKESQLTSALVKEVKRRLFDESIPRIEKCLSLLSTEQIWRRPNDSSNSIGNLILHLIGNVRQYILSGIGKFPDHRKRGLEFTSSPNLPAAELISRLHELRSDVESVLPVVDSSELLRSRSVQCFEETGLSILIHVTEHFSYHTGQIALLTKLYVNEDLEFYPGLDLEATGDGS